MSYQSLKIETVWREKMQVCDTWALYLKAGDLCIDIDGGRTFSGASLIKTFIFELILKEVEKGALTWSDKVPIQPLHCAVGDGILSEWQLPQTLDLYSVSHMMITLSDNTATNALVDFLGGTVAVNDCLADEGYKQSRLLRWVGGSNRDPREDLWKPADGTPTQSGISVVTAREHALSLERICALEDGQRILSQQNDLRSLARYLKLDSGFAHKTGTADGVRHNGGILTLPSGETVNINCLTDGPEREEFIDDYACKAMGSAFEKTLEILELNQFLR